MKTSIDKAGRVVIPAAIRTEARLGPGTKIEVMFEEGSVKIQRLVPRARLAQTGKRWVARPAIAEKQRTRVDAARLAEEERNRWPW
jgi:AbrB family looped-hinge helix DNA binding protein